MYSLVSDSKILSSISFSFLPWWLRWQSLCLQCGRPGFDPWVRKIPWRKKWHPTPVLLPGKSHGRRSLVGYRPWCCKKSDTTEQLHFTSLHAWCKSALILFFLIFIFTLFYSTILYWFCHTLTGIHHRCTWVPKHEPPFHLPPHIISLDHPGAPAPSILYPASNIDWRFVSYVIVYMFQCHSPSISFKYIYIYQY